MGAAPDVEPRPDDPDRDRRLLDQARAGDAAAFEELYAEHAAAARRLATLLGGPDGADDLVSETFARILDLLRSGGGPSTNFRAYVYAAVRNRYRDNLRTSHERPASDAPWLLDSHEPSAEELVPGIHANGAVAALTSLPGTWQQVLWYLEVEGRKPAEVADLLTMSPVAVSSLAYRAREGLRRAYLDQHLGAVGAVPEQCRWTRDRLSQYVRDDLSRRASAKVADHVAGCAGCTAAFAELDSLNKKLAAYLAPVVLVGGMKALEAATAGSAPAGSLAGALGNRLDGSSGAGAGAAGAQVAGAFALADLSARAIAVIALAAAGTVAAAATAWAVIAHDDHPAARKPVAHATETPTPTPAPVAVVPTPRPTPPPPDATVLPPVAEPAEPIAEEVAGPVAEPSDQPQAAPRPELVVVRTRAPLAVPISGCGSYGSLTLPQTTGVRYALTTGDGRQGLWEVTASARQGYRIAEGAPRRFTGNLGTYAACPVPPSIGAVAKVAQGDPVVDPWDVTVTPVVPGSTPAGTVEVVYVFTSAVFVEARSGAGWTCREPGGGEVGAGTEYYFPDPGTAFTCSFDFTGTAPPAVTMTVLAVDAAMQVIEPSGQVTLRTGGTQDDQRSF